MGESYLMCNNSKCRQELKTQAWVTCCSHIFCMEHGQNSVDKGNCLACANKFSGRYDIVVMDLNPSEQHKTMVLSGLSPEKVLDIANKALMFWTYQMYQERVFSDATLRAAKQHSAELADYYETVNAKHKVDSQKLKREIADLQKELDEKGKQIENLVSQLAEKTRLSKHLQNQYEALKRKSVSNYIPSEKEYYAGKQYDNHEYDEPRSSDVHKHAYPAHMYDQDMHPAKHSRDRHVYKDNQDKDFVFMPVTSNSSSKQSIFPKYHS